MSSGQTWRSECTSPDVPFLLKTSSFKKEARAALLASKRAIDANQLSNRDELLRSSAVREKQDLNEKVAYAQSISCAMTRLTGCEVRMI